MPPFVTHMALDSITLSTSEKLVYDQLWATVTVLTYFTLFCIHSYHDIVTPLTHFEGITTHKTQYSTPPLYGSALTSATTTSYSTSSEPIISDENKDKYARMFAACGPVSGLLGSDKAREVFLKSRLPAEKLNQIWYVQPQCTYKTGALY